jgi:hypothetical protein
MTTLALRTGYPIAARRDVRRAIAAVTATVGRVVEVLAEAEHLSAAARERYPLAD